MLIREAFLFVSFLEVRSNMANESTSVQFIPGRKMPLWVEAIAVVRFDLLVGQTIDYLFPPIPFSITQELELAFLCFPDANYVADGDAQHDFVYAYSKCEMDPTRTSIKRESAGKAPADKRQAVVGNNAQELFCSTLFRQKKDVTIARGASQKAILVLSKYPFPGLLHQLLHRMCAAFFDFPNVAPEEFLSAAFHDISLWPPPLPDMAYHELPFVGALISFVTPSYTPTDVTALDWSSSNAPLSGVAIRYPGPLHLLQLQLQASNLDAPALNAKLREAAAFSQCFAEQALAAGWSVDKGYESTPSPLVIEKLYFAACSILEDPPTATEEATSDSSVDSVVALYPRGRLVSNIVCKVQNIALRALQKECTQYLSAASLIVHKSLRPAEPKEKRALLDEVDEHRALYPHLSKCWKFWELIVTGASIAILAGNAPLVSAAAMSLASIAAPLRYHGLLRPYITINNRELDTCATPQPPSNSIVGVTNPFFVKHFERWPHFLCFGNATGDVQTHKMLPCDSEKRQKQQFKLKNRMFCSKHFLVKTDKQCGETVVGIEPSPDGNYVDQSKELSKNSQKVRAVMFELTQEFLEPLVQFFAHTLTVPLFFADNRTVQEALSKANAIDFVSRSSSTVMTKFKTPKDALCVYEAFLGTPTYQHWAAEQAFSTYRNYLLHADNLESVVRECPPPLRVNVLQLLQWDFERVLHLPIVDVKLATKLSTLCLTIPSVRQRLLS